MAHYTILIVISNKHNRQPTEDDFFNVLKNNCTTEYEGAYIYPFGFDYVYSISNVLKGEDINKYSISEIIIDEEEIWWCDGISSIEPEISKQDALNLIDKNDWCMLFDGHL